MTTEIKLINRRRAGHPADKPIGVMNAGTNKITGKREVRALSRSLNDKPEQEITNHCRR
jgi:hypothetical protein